MTVESCLVALGLAVRERWAADEPVLSESEVRQAAVLFASHGLLSRRAAAPSETVLRLLTRSVHVSHVHLTSPDVSAKISWCRGNHFPRLGVQSFATRHPPFPAGFVEVTSLADHELSRIKTAIQALPLVRFGRRNDRDNS